MRRSMTLFGWLALGPVGCGTPLGVPSVDAHPSDADLNAADATDAARDAFFSRDGDTHWSDANREPPDAWRDDVSPLSAAVRVVLRDLTHAPVVDSPVVFHDASGAPLDQVTTDADGVAVSGRVGIAAITVRMPDVPSLAPGAYGLDYPAGLYSLWGVEAGDTITIDMPVAPRSVSALAFGVADHMLFTAASSMETTSLVSTVWDSIAFPGVVGYLTSPDASGHFDYAVALGGASTDIAYLDRTQSLVDTIPTTVHGLPSGWRVQGWGAVGSDVGMLRMTLTNVPLAAIDHTEILRGLDPGPASYLAITASDDRGTSSSHHDIVVPYDHALDASGISFDASTVTNVAALAIDHATLEVSWGTVVAADVVALSLAYPSGGGSVEWLVVAPGPRDRLAPPQLPVSPGMPTAAPGTVFAQCSVSFQSRAALHDYAAFRSHPLGPFDRTGWAGTQTVVWDQPF